jgi:hypothetical protein
MDSLGTAGGLPGFIGIFLLVATVALLVMAGRSQRTVMVNEAGLTVQRGNHLGQDGQFEQVAAQKARGKEEHFKGFDGAGFGIQASHDVISKFFGFLLSVRRTFVDIENVAIAVVPENQFRFHSRVTLANGLPDLIVSQAAG